MQFPITIGLHRSFFLDLALFAIASLATAITVAMPWPGGVRAAICLLIPVAAYFAWRRFGMVPSAIRLEASGQIQVAPAGDGQFVEAAVLPGATVHPWLTVVRLKTEEEREVLLIVAVDTIKPEDFRRLRVFLRWRAEISASAVDGP